MTLLILSKDSISITASGANKSRENLEPLTALRFFAAAMIVFYHSGKPLGIDPSNISCLGTLEQGVSFFFVLSGFILFYSYQELLTEPVTSKYFIARFARIWPSHIAANLLFACCHQFWLPLGAAIPWITLANICLLQAWIPQSQSYFSLNSPSWSISAELLFYLVFPFLIKNWTNTWRRKLISTFSVVMFFILLCEGLKIYGTHTPTYEIYHALLYINPLTRLFEFALGMAAATFFIRRRPYFQMDTLKATVLECGVVLLIIANLFITPLLVGQFRQSDHLNALFYWIYESSGAPIYACLITLIGFKRGLVSKFLSLPALNFLGVLSYSIYLFHWIILQFFQDHRFWTSLPMWTICALYWSCLLSISTLNYYLIEQPFRILIRNAIPKNIGTLLKRRFSV